MHKNKTKWIEVQCQILNENFAEKKVTSFSRFRNLFYKKGPLDDIAKWDICYVFLGITKLFQEKSVGYLWLKKFKDR